MVYYQIALSCLSWKRPCEKDDQVNPVCYICLLLERNNHAAIFKFSLDHVNCFINQQVTNKHFAQEVGKGTILTGS